MEPQRRNRLLSALSSENREFLLSRCTPVQLPQKLLLAQAEATPKYAYFVTSGMVSVVTTMRDGGTAEVGVIGCEGIIGSIHLLGPGKVPTSSFVQLEGTALRIRLVDLRWAFRSSEEIRDRILEFLQEHALVTGQIAGCNRLHEAEQRLARWLLMAQDRAQTEEMHFTQEFLSTMVGSRRTTVTIIAAGFQRAGLTEYTRGRVRILDRGGLEAVACDCYQIAKDLFNDLYRSVPD